MSTDNTTPDGSTELTSAEVRYLAVKNARSASLVGGAVFGAAGIVILETGGTAHWGVFLLLAGFATLFMGRLREDGLVRAAAEFVGIETGPTEAELKEEAGL